MSAALRPQRWGLVQPKKQESTPTNVEGNLRDGGLMTESELMIANDELDLELEAMVGGDAVV